MAKLPRLDLGKGWTGPPRIAWPDVVKTALTVAATVAVSELMLWLGVDRQALIMVYLVSVLLISRRTDGYAYGIVSTVLITFIHDFLVTEPRMAFSFTIGFPITLCAMLLLAVSTSTLTIQMKKQAGLARERERRALLLYEVTQRLLAARGLEAVVAVTQAYIVGQTGRSVIFYTADPQGPQPGAVAACPADGDGAAILGSPEERAAAHRVFANPAEAENPGAAGRGGVHYVPVVFENRVLGLIGVLCAREALGQPAVLFVRMLAAQVALALELQTLAEEQRKTLIEAEREKARAILLRAISHDLRTPLTGILGASSTLLEQGERLDRQTGQTLMTDIRESTQWLIRIVENLLSVTRISEGAVRLRKTLEAAEEVVAEATSVVRRRFPDQSIHIRVPEALLLVPMEPTLICQVLVNLLENSVKNSEPGSLILLDVKKKGDWAEFSVSDSGRGIPEQMLGNLFEGASSGSGQSVDAVRGLGIGLLICKTVVAAHGGSITGRNKQDGGAWFGFSLPLKESELDGQQRENPGC